MVLDGAVEKVVTVVFLDERVDGDGDGEVGEVRERGVRVAPEVVVSVRLEDTEADTVVVKLKLEEVDVVNEAVELVV